MKVSILHLFKSAKLYFCLAVLLLVAKPFLGFNIFTSLRRPVHQSILVKAFTKRKQEYSEDSDFNISSTQKKLADPVNLVLLRFSFLLSILFPAVFMAGLNITNRLLREINLSLYPAGPVYLLNGSLAI